MPPGPGYIKQAWYKWKTLQLPWRSQYLVGADLSGNTFWEFKDHLNANRLRRIVKYRKTHYADIKISPQWHQWLRHTRDGPPSIQEQQYDVSRQATMKQLAAEADERWKSVPSYLDSPKRQQPAPAIGVEAAGGQVQQTAPEEGAGVKSAVGDQDDVAESVSQGERRSKGRREREENPWQKAQRGAPGENWQPEAWTPGVVQRR